MTVKLIGNDNQGITNRANNTVHLTKFTADVSGSLSELKIWARVVGYAKVAVYSDAAGVPGTRLAKQDTGYAAPAGFWTAVPLEAPCDIVQGSSYWLAAIASATGTLSNDANTTDPSQYKSEVYGTYTWPATFSGGTEVSRRMSYQGWGTAITAPTVQTDDPSGVLIHEATLHGTLLADGGVATKVRFNYGKTEAYGTNTEWQEGKYTNDQFQQLISTLDSNSAYHFRAEANNAGGTSYGGDKQFATQAEPILTRTILITHPALKRVRVLADSQVQANYDQLSNPDQSRIQSSLKISIRLPVTIEVTTLADQVFNYELPA